MKKFIMAMFVMVSMSFADMSFSTNEMRFCEYAGEGSYSCSQYKEYPSLFEIKEGSKIIFHTISTMQSTYFVKTMVFDDEKQALVVDVVSDAGNYYTFAFFKEIDKIIIQVGAGEGSYQLDYKIKNRF